MFYILEGLIFTIVAADMSGIHGRWAREIKLPLGAVAEEIWIAVPLVFMLVSFSEIRKRLGRWLHAVHAIAFVCPLIPPLVFHAQTSQIPLNGFPDTEVCKVIREQFDNQILFVSDGGGTRAYVSSAINRNHVAEVIYKLDPKINPTSTEQHGGGQSDARSEPK